MKRTFVFAAIVSQILLSAETLVVKTKAPKNRQAVFQYRVPKGYDRNRSGSYRVLVIFGGRNTDGRADASGRMGWGKWCDDNGIFILAPGLKNDNYWQPEVWSGKALRSALSQLKKKYKICTSKLLFYGYSAGSQASNLFPAWRPSLCRAWVSHACGVFHTPSAKMSGVPGLVTCGDADQARYIISRNFVESARRKGCRIIWKSFPNHPHDVPPDSLTLARAFLLYHHRRWREDLAAGALFAPEDSPAEFIGDDQDSVYYPANSPKAKNVLPEDRVELPDKTLADAWGKRAQ
ncbi:MAG: hypothetical protein IJU70_02320 [Lentisphaeria bacterium]|nr:hypothetical protein [Lentisphaeria bacterium]